MNPINAAWFSFKGVYSYQMGARLISYPTRYQPALKGKSKAVTGRDGSIWVGDGHLDDVDVTVNFVVPDADDRSDVNAWMTGTGRLVFGDEPYAAYDARIVKTYKRAPVVKRLEGLEYQITFSCQPYRHVIPETQQILVNAAADKLESYTLYNPYNAPALPRIVVNGAGDFNISINGEAMYFYDVDGDLVVDSELMDVLTYDLKQSANNQCSGTPWTLRPGDNVITWSQLWDEDERNGLDLLLITPRWRCL